MDENEIRVPVFFINGFLESGKTSFLKDTIAQDYFKIDEKTVLILCEEGEVEYEEKELKKNNIQVIKIDEEEDFTHEAMCRIDARYEPARVIIEWNGMWPVRNFEQIEMPKGWGIIQQITCVDASTLGPYLVNLKQLFSDMVRNSDMVYFNRCTEDLPLASYRRSVKVINQAADAIFEDVDGNECNIFKEQLPFDINAEVIEIAPEDYGIWYVDALDDPKKYVGKKVRFTALVIKSRKPKAPYFVPCRMAMTCCAADMQLIGFVCSYSKAPTLKEGDWIDITAKVGYGFSKVYRGKGIILEPVSIESTKGLDEPYVYFN
ncbi:MAG: GTPase [Lachnospiraceae bacterium]|nr:GTPase [Lachnospiraceae bacterium]